jgi:hypothetical protein
MKKLSKAKIKSLQTMIYRMSCYYDANPEQLAILAKIYGESLKLTK